MLAPSPSLLHPALAHPAQRVLYFDIDGTLVVPTFGAAKPALAHGRFERAVRAAGFDRLVCVSDALDTARLAADPRAGHADAFWRRIFALCRGTLRSEAWFRTHVEAVAEPRHRALAIDRYEDWYYVDDRARAYAARVGLAPEESQGRVLECEAHGDGADVIAWLASIGHEHAWRQRWRAPGRRAQPSWSSRVPAYDWRRV